MAYKFLTQLSDITWLVVEVKTNSHYILKKVECGDELEANDLYHKMIAYQKLHHPFLVPYHHLYVSWDEERAVYLCIVSNHMTRGSLEKLLSEYRENCQWIEQTLLQKWIGQLIEGLVFTHRHHLCHKRLKSSNIYLSDDNTLCIGDQAPSLRSSITASSLNWFSPETMDINSDSDYDERSDIWSLGCVLLEMTTTGCLNSTQFLAALYQLKVNPNVLDDLLKQIAVEYGQEMSQLIQLMLRQSYHQRPLAIDLCDKPIIRTCLSLYDSPLLKELTTLTDKQDIITAKLRKSKFSLSAQITLLDELIITLQDTDLKPALLDLIMTSLNQYKSSPNLVAKSLHVLYLSLGHITNKYDGIISLSTAALEIHPNEFIVVKPALHLLVSLSTEDSAVSNMITIGILNMALRVVESFPETPDVLCPSFVLLLNLIKPKSVLNAAVCGKMVDLVCKALQAHSCSSSLVSAGFSLLWVSMSSEEALMRICTPSNATLISQLLHLHKEDVLVVKLGMGLLTMLCTANEDMLYCLADHRVSPYGLSVIIEIIRCQSHNEDVMEQTLLLFAELTKHDDIRAELIHRNAREALSACTNTTNTYLSKEFKGNIQMLVYQLME